MSEHQVAEIFVLEKSPRWRPELDRQLAGSRIRVSACQEVTNIRDRIQETDSCSERRIVVVEMAGRGGECLPLITWLARRDIGVIVTGDEGLGLLEPSLREIGAADVLLPPVSGSSLADRCRRLLGGDGSR